MSATDPVVQVALRRRLTYVPGELRLPDRLTGAIAGRDISKA